MKKWKIYSNYIALDETIVEADSLEEAEEKFWESNIVEQKMVEANDENIERIEEIK